MSWLIILSFLLVLNIMFGIRDVNKGSTTKSAAFTWFVVGWVSFHVITEAYEMFGG
jgi:hypothetical protein